MSVKQRERARFLRNWRDERDSAALYGALAALERNPRLRRVLARLGHLGNNLRAAVLGANDGLASNFCLLMGVAGGAMPAGAIVLTGVAGLVAGACSMALGEWLSVTNACEMARSHTDTDARELHTTTV